MFLQTRKLAFTEVLFIDIFFKLFLKFSFESQVFSVSVQSIINLRHIAIIAFGRRLFRYVALLNTLVVMDYILIIHVVVLFLSYLMTALIDVAHILSIKDERLIILADIVEVTCFSGHYITVLNDWSPLVHCKVIFVGTNVFTFIKQHITFIVAMLSV